MAMSEPIRPWQLYPQFWKTEAAFLSFIRGGIRRHLWAKNPVKLEFIKEARKMITNPNVKLRKGRPKVWGGVCEMCNKEHILKNMEVDHKTGEFTLRQVTDIQKFVEGIVFVRKEDLAFLCKPCHKGKTYSERFSVSLEDAIIEKRAIAIMKGDEKAWLTSQGLTPASNAKLRRVQITKHLKEAK